jgi:hypothetical protein
MNLLRENYHTLKGKNKTAFRLKVTEICGWKSEKSFYNRVKDDYIPSPIEELAFKMIVDGLTQN